MAKTNWWRAPETRSACLLGVGLLLIFGVSEAVLWWLADTSPVPFVVLFIIAAILTGLWIIRWSRRTMAGLQQASDQLAAARHGQANYAIALNDEGLFSQLNNQVYHYVRQTEALRSDLQRDRDQLSQAITDIAHQLRTPIATIGNLSELLAADNVPLTKAELIRQNDWLAQLVAQLILLARIDTHTLSQQKQPILVDTLLKSSLNPLLPLISDKNLKIAWQVPATLQVQVNPDLFREAVINVLKNASEHAPTGSTLTIAAAETPMAVTISLTNQDPAIAPTDLPRLFDRFYRGVHSDPNNVGIGLAIAAGIAQASDGHLQAANTTAGVTFTFSLYK